MAQPGLKRLRQLTARFRVEPGASVKLPKDFDPGFTADFGKDDAGKAQDLLQQGIALLTEYQDRLAAQDTHALLVVLQGLDAAGKDSTIKHVMSGMNPQWVDVHPFKVPSDEELNHDYLWRYEQKLPRRGMIGIFNRSHYEEVLVVRVHPELLDTQHLPADHRDPDIWTQRFKAINAWERYLAENGIQLVKLFRTFPARNSGSDSWSGSTNPRRTGSSLRPTSVSAHTGTRIRRPTRTSSPTPAPSGHPGT